MRLPKKLKKDSIAEALLQVRFESAESSEVPELVVAKLASFLQWKDYQKARLPIADIPTSLRSQTPGMRYQPMLELKSPETARIVRIGENAVSLHALEPYPTWQSFKPELDEMIKGLFREIADFRPTRLGLRYINRLNRADHLIGSVSDLSYSAKVADEAFEGPQNFNYRKKRSDTHEVLVRVASPEFVTGPGSQSLNALIDVDVFTPDDWNSADLNGTLSWVETAHDIEKEEFFKLIPPKILTELIET